MKLGLVLEGGGMRGLYTVGVLDALMERRLSPDYVIGVSAGAGNGISFVSGQKGRAYRVDMDYLRDRRYISLRNFVKTRSVFGMDFVFDDIPGKYDPFNYPLFSPPHGICHRRHRRGHRPPRLFRQAAAHGRPVPPAARLGRHPLFSPMVEFRGRLYLDGGTADPIPVKRALADGCDKVLVVLTQHREYVKSPPASPPSTAAPSGTIPR